MVQWFALEYRKKTNDFHSNETINAALKVTAHPVLISHTGLDTQLGQNPNIG
jgi:hypothetical protein